MHCVLDSSATLAWLLPGEATPRTDTLLAAVSEQGAIVPGLRSLEVANVFSSAERRGRITAAKRSARWLC